LIVAVGAAVAAAGGSHESTTGQQPLSPPAHAVSGLPPVPQPTPANSRLLSYFYQAQISVLSHNPGCRRFSRPSPTSQPNKVNNGTPSQAILAAFGVFRLQQPPQPVPAFLRGDVYARYIRVAQRRYGDTFDVTATSDGAPARPVSPHCRKLESEALNKLLAHVPQSERVRALRLAHDVLLDQQYIEHHPETVCLIGGGGAGCQAFLYAQARGGLGSSGSGNQGSLWTYLVPDGVATVTAHYPAEGPKTGFLHTWPPITITVPVFNNVAVWKLKSEPGDLFPTTITWRSASGKAVKVAYPG
jgi:hypothetical protein